MLYRKSAQSSCINVVIGWAVVQHWKMRLPIIQLAMIMMRVFHQLKERKPKILQVQAREKQSRAAGEEVLAKIREGLQILGEEAQDKGRGVNAGRGRGRSLSKENGRGAHAGRGRGETVPQSDNPEYVINKSLEN